MNRAIYSILFTGLICIGAPAIADEATPASASAMSDSTAAPSQAIKDCIAAQKAKDSTKSHADLQKACADATTKLPATEKDNTAQPKDSQSASPKP